MITERDKLAADLDRKILQIDQKIERATEQRQRADTALADLYRARQALLAANDALVREAAE